jgi:DNA-binding PadR family transcriptional regulator
MQADKGSSARSDLQSHASERPDEGHADHHEVAEYALLGLLRAGPAHGYRLAAAFAPDGWLGPIVHLKMSLMYAYLHKMERQGWLRAHVEVVDSVRARRVFTLTAEGERAFDQWIAQPVVATREVRLDFMVKLTFAIEQDRAQAAVLLARQHTALSAWLDRLRAQEATQTSETPVSTRSLALSHRIRQSEATLAWLEDVRARL